MAEGEQEDNAQKTEEPTPKKIEESRKKGQVALSREINNWVMLFAGTILVAGLASAMLGDLTVIMKGYISQSHAMPAGSGGLGEILAIAFKDVIKTMALPLIILTLAAFFAPFLQVGPLFAPEAIKPDISKISIFKGFGRLFSMRSLTEFAKGIFKIAAVAAVGTVILVPYFGQMEHFVGLPIIDVLKELQSLVIWLMIGVLIVVLVIAVIDLVYQRYDNNQKMRMTKQEVKDEYKQTEGDPHVKARLRQLRMERGRQRMMQAVPGADVVITNPTHFSIALKYDPETMEAPMCVAKGTDEIALRIREVAKENNIELYENKPLARSLYDVVEIDQSIPIEFYQAVAEVISFVFKRKGKLH
ncbi:MAG: flagellar biosynthesis protein FlhB [Bdellovibrionales bacterium]